MEVTVQSTLKNEAQGRVKLACDPEDTIDSLISGFCIQKGVRQKQGYSLKTINNEILHSTRRLETCGIKDGDTLYLTSPAADEKTYGCSNWWILAGVCLLIGGVGIIALSILKVRGDIVPKQYGIVLDAGSSRTSVFVYEWEGDKDNGTGVVTQIGGSCKTKIPLSDFEDDPSKAADAFNKCLPDFGLKNIPTNKHGETPIFLAATAGMRMLEKRNKTASDAIMKTVRDTIATYPFKLTHPEKQLRILTGGEEGAFSWVTSNYLSGNFGHRDDDIDGPGTGATVGALDLGGASTQITFVPKEEDQADIPVKNHENLMMFGKNYQVYTDTFLCYGKDQIERRLLTNLVQANNYSTTIVNPCGPKDNATEFTFEFLFEAPCTKGEFAINSFGTEVVPSGSIPRDSVYRFIGSSNSSECAKVTEDLFNFTNCQQKHCSFNNHYLPPINGNFLAFSGFYYTMDFLNLTKRAGVAKPSLTDLETAADRLCNMNWDQVKDMESYKASALPFYCFDGIYIKTILKKGYGFDEQNWDKLTFTYDIDGTKVGWSVGFMMNVTNSIPAIYNPQAVSPLLFGLITVLFVIFIILAVFFACQAKNQRQRAQDYQNLSGYGTV